MKEELIAAAKIIKSGGTIACPADTIWGLSCDATNLEAVDKVKQIKGRDADKPFVILVSSDGMLERLVPDLPEVAWDLIELSEKPVTIVFSNVTGIAKNALASDGSAGIRLVREGFIHQLINRLNRPLVSSSANPSGQPSPTNFSSVDKGILGLVDYVVNLPDYPTTGQPSSIIRLGSAGKVEIIRK